MLWLSEIPTALVKERLEMGKEHNFNEWKDEKGVKGLGQKRVNYRESEAEEKVEMGMVVSEGSNMEEIADMRDRWQYKFKVD